MWLRLWFPISFPHHYFSLCGYPSEHRADFKQNQDSDSQREACVVLVWFLRCLHVWCAEYLPAYSHINWQYDKLSSHFSYLFTETEEVKFVFELISFATPFMWHTSQIGLFGSTPIFLSISILSQPLLESFMAQRDREAVIWFSSPWCDYTLELVQLLLLTINGTSCNQGSWYALIGCLSFDFTGGVRDRLIISKLTCVRPPQMLKNK